MASGPGIHVFGSHYGSYRAAINVSYADSLRDNNFDFNNIADLTTPSPGEAAILGQATANEMALSRFIEEAIQARHSHHMQLGKLYLEAASAQQQVQIEWQVLSQDIVSTLPFYLRVDVTNCY